MTPAPPKPFPPVNRHVLDAGVKITRIHHGQFEANSFNPAIGRPTRFAPVVLSSGDFVPHLYAAQGYECAAHESIFHDVQHDAAHKSVAMAKVEPLRLSELRCRRSLTLASLFEPDLNAWNMTRGDLIDTYASQYVATAAWAAAIHEASDVDGLIWTSRRCDPKFAMMLFGDRVAEDDLEILSTVAISGDNDALSALRAIGVRANIVLTL